MMNLKDKACLIVDLKLFTELAVTLSKSFGWVGYYSRWESEFPHDYDRQVGTGIPNVYRVDDIWQIGDRKHGIMTWQDVDLFVFPDLCFSGLQLHLQDMGKLVWGSRDGEELECFRGEAKRYFKKIGINVGPYKEVTGIDELRKHLKANDNQWIKVNNRGSLESCFAPNYAAIEAVVSKWEYQFGPMGKKQKFICEDNLEDCVEIAYDAYTVDGIFPKVAMAGVEVKDEGYVGSFKPYASLPKQILEVNEKLAPAYKEYGYKNFCPIEILIDKKGKYYAEDPCMRFASPPNEGFQVACTNMAEVLYRGAEGECVEPEYQFQHVAQLQMHSAWSEENRQAVLFPEKIRKFVKLRNFCMVDDQYYVLPSARRVSLIGSVVGLGKTRQAAIEQCREHAKLIEGHSITMKPECLDSALGKIKKLKAYGVEI